MESNRNQAGKPGDFLESDFANDPDMKEILEMFIQEMPERVAQLQASWEGRHLDGLRRLAHQLKGAGGGYGYPSLSGAAGELESTLQSIRDGEVERIKTQLDELVNLCQRMSSR
jgi:HPt (histidine-containing phosphotransfer) domain-containing protein